MIKQGDQVGFTDDWMGRDVLMTAEVIAIPNDKQALLSPTGFWGPLPNTVYAMDVWFTHPLTDPTLRILEGEDLEYLHSFDDETN